MDNRFEQALAKTFQELNLIIGHLSSLEVLVDHGKKSIEQDSRYKNGLVVTYALFEDVTTDKTEDHLGFSCDYLLTRMNFYTESEIILSRECLFQVAQAYEMLETYLYDQVAELLRLKQDAKNSPNSFDELREQLKKEAKKSNNKHLLTQLRNHSAIYKKYEVKNGYINFNEWYRMFSEVRHCVTHKRMVVDQRLLNKLPPCFKKYMQLKRYNDKTMLYLDPNGCRRLLMNTASYIFFVYKSVIESCYGRNVSTKDVEALLKTVSYGTKTL